VGADAVRATWLGIPVSTTHTITGAIIGVGAARRVSAVRWGLAGNIVIAWVVTLPAAALIASSATTLKIVASCGARRADRATEPARRAAPSRSRESAKIPKNRQRQAGRRSTRGRRAIVGSGMRVDPITMWPVE
jgi:hypothetical protein